MRWQRAPGRRCRASWNNFARQSADVITTPPDSTSEAAEAEFPLVTVVVPTRPGQQSIPAVDAARKLDYPPDKLEIIVARGKQPAIQRNHALREARGEIIYFLDDDAMPDPGSLREALAHF